VTINTVGWAVGKPVSLLPWRRSKGKRRFAIQILSGRYTNQYPIELAYGRSARFMVSLRASPNWANEFATGFIRDLSDHYLKTLMVQVHTSVGQTVEVRPHNGVLEEIKRAPVEANKNR
jgi:hypothetical protein